MILAANVSYLAFLCKKEQFLPLTRVVDPCSISLAVDLKEQEVANEELLTAA